MALHSSNKATYPHRKEFWSHEWITTCREQLFSTLPSISYFGLGFRSNVANSRFFGDTFKYCHDGEIRSVSSNEVRTCSTGMSNLRFNGTTVFCPENWTE